MLLHLFGILLISKVLSRGLYSTTVSPTPIPSSELTLLRLLFFELYGCYEFHMDFILGVTSSAVQIKGAVVDEGRAPTQNELGNYTIITLVSEYEHHCTSNENYYLYKQDIVHLAVMGVKYYSISFSCTGF